MRKVCSERIWERCKTITSSVVAGMILSAVFTVFIIASALGVLVNYLGNVMLPSRKEKGGA